MIKITAAPLTHPSYSKFTRDLDLMPDKYSIWCRTETDCQGNALLLALWNLGGITQIGVEKNKILIAKNIPTPWPVLGKEIGAVIRDRLALQSPEELFNETFLAKFPAKVAGSNSMELAHNQNIQNKELADKIIQTLDVTINPMLSSHGGHVVLADLQGETVLLRFGGGCQGCSQVSTTVKNGVEKILLEKFELIKKVVDITDHEKGNNPFYK